MVLAYVTALVLVMMSAPSMVLAHAVLLKRVLVISYVLVLSCFVALARGFCFVSLCYGVNPFHRFSPCFGVSPFYGVIPRHVVKLSYVFMLAMLWC